MAPGRSFCSVQNVLSFPLLTLLLLISSPTQVTALTTLEGTYIIGGIFLLFVVVDIFLIIYFIAWIKNEKARKNYEYKKDMIRQRSVECLESNVKLQIRRKISSVGSESSSEETSFNEGGKVNLSVCQEMEGYGTDNVFGDNETVDKSFEERKKEAQLNRPNTRTESETPLLIGGDVNVEESLQPGKLLQTVKETPPGEVQFIRLQSSDFRKDNKALLLDNEIIIEGQSLSSHSSPLCQSPVKHLPIDEEEEGDIQLVSLASKITGPILPTDSPPHSIPREIQSLDVTITSGVETTTETSFTTGTDPLHSTSATSIGWSDVFELIQDNNTNIENTIKSHAGQLAPEVVLSMSAEIHDSNNSINGSTYSNNIQDNSSKNQTPTCDPVKPANHERAYSYDDHVPSFEKSFPPYLTPQHALPRPRGRSNPGTGSLSLTNSPARRNH